jgi:hypothetical protein
MSFARSARTRVLPTPHIPNGLTIAPATEVRQRCRCVRAIMPDKGKVEGLVGWIRRNCFVPMPRVASFEALSAKLKDDCRGRLGVRLRSHAETIGERLVRDLAACHALPATPYEACEKRTGRVSSLSLVRYRGTDYSVPTAFGHREVLIRG